MPKINIPAEMHAGCLRYQDWILGMTSLTLEPTGVGLVDKMKRSHCFTFLMPALKVISRAVQSEPNHPSVTESPNSGHTVKSSPGSLNANTITRAKSAVRRYQIQNQYLLSFKSTCILTQMIYQRSSYACQKKPPMFFCPSCHNSTACVSLHSVQVAWHNILPLMWCLLCKK